MYPGQDRIGGGAVLWLWLVVGLAEAADLSGHWVLDAGASQPIDPILAAQGVSWAKRKAAEYLDTDCTIVQSGERLVLTFRGPLGTVTQTLVADGQPHATVNPAGLPTTWTTSWQGEALVSVGTTQAEGQQAALTERRTLSADQQVLSLALTLSAGGQQTTVQRVFRRAP